MDLSVHVSRYRTGGDLYRSLRCQKRRRTRYGTYSRRGCIPKQVSMAVRPAVVHTRQQLGDWEGDTGIRKGHSGVLMPLVERQAKYPGLQGLPHKTAAAVRKAVAHGLQPDKSHVRTSTDDNGRECSDQAGMAQDLDAQIDFAHPDASWERGVNENPTGLIRQFFPTDRD